MSVWRALDSDRRLAAGAAGGLFVTMLLPWYQQNAVVNAPRTTPLQSRNLNAFQAFSFVEAAVLLVAVAVLYLLYARAQDGRDFHLPGSDGAVIMAAGLWSALLLVFRLFAKPGISSHGVAANVGVQWGIFFALGAAGLLAYAGSRMRAARRPEPPLARPPRGRRDGRGALPRSPYPPAPALPAGHVPAPSPAPAQAPAVPTRRRAPAPSRRPVPASPPTERLPEQLSFEDPPAHEAD